MNVMATVVGAGILTALSCSAQAAEFTIFIYEPPSELAKRAAESDHLEYWKGYNQFAAGLASAGILRGGSALSERQSTVIRGKGGSATAFRGARLGGYFVIDVVDLESAKHWASTLPPGAIGVEIAAHRPNPTMPAMAAPSSK